MKTKKTESKKVAEANMKYLELDTRRYAVYRKLMSLPMNQWPEEADSYIRTAHGKEPVCGDAIACWVAEWVKNRPDYVDAIIGKKPKPIRVLRLS